MSRASSLVSCTLLALVAGCGAESAASHPAVRHARTPTPPESSPLWVADQYYVAPNFPAERAHIMGEFAQHFGSKPTLGSLLAPSASVTLRPVVEHADSAMVAATIADPAHRRTAEWYTYLVRDGGAWKIYAVRTVEFTPAFYARVDSAATRDQRSSMMIAAGSDSALRAFVVSHIGRLDSLVTAYRAAPDAPAMVDARDTVASGRADAQSAVRRLLAASDVSTVFYNPANPACTFVRIAGEGRRQVGAIRADQGCRVPPMSPAGLVYTEHVQGDWYVYRAL